MYVFETKNNIMKIKCAGYVLPENIELDETTTITQFESLPTDKFWFKLDDYGDYWVGTFLFPNEY